MKLSVRWVLAIRTLCMGSVGTFAQARLTQTVDLSTWQGGSLGPLPPLPLPATGFSLSSIAFDPGIGVITLDVVDASTYQLIASAAGVPDQSGIWLINNANILPRPIAINTRTNMLYVLNSASSTISVFDGKTNALTGTIAVPIPDGAVVSQPYDPTTGPVDLKPGNTIYMQSTSTLSTLGGAIAMTVNEADNLLYVATVTGKVLIYTLDPPTAPPAYSLNGVIRDTFGAPSAGITVKAAGTNGTATAVTDANGVFFLTGLPTGTYTVTPTPGAFSFSPASVTVSINDQNTGGVTFQQNPPVAPGSFSLNPWTMIGPGVTTTGTITLNQPAPAGGAIVTLTSSNTRLVKLPSTVTVPAGQISVLLPIQGSGASAPTPVTLTATYNGSSASTTLTVAPADKLTLNYALLSLSQAQLFISATDSNPQATLQVYLASGNQFLGTMVNQGNGSYTFQMPFVQSGIAVNVVSNLGGKVGKGIGITF